MVGNLINRTFAWENERNKPFLYDGVSILVGWPIASFVISNADSYMLFIGAPNICSRGIQT
jgi:hypothetical protein